MSDQHQGFVAAASAPAGRAATEVNHVIQLSQDLGQLCRSEEFCDVVLTVDGHRFSAHRAVLAARSEYFRWAPLSRSPGQRWNCGLFLVPALYSPGGLAPFSLSGLAPGRGCCSLYAAHDSSRDAKFRGV